MAGTSEVPEEKRCTCHDEVMIRVTDSRYKSGHYFRCRVNSNAGYRRRYAERPGIWYSRKLLQNRRNKARYRRAKREAA